VGEREKVATTKACKTWQTQLSHPRLKAPKPPAWPQPCLTHHTQWTNHTATKACRVGGTVNESHMVEQLMQVTCLSPMHSYCAIPLDPKGNGIGAHTV